MSGFKERATQFLDGFSYSNKIKLILVLSLIAIAISAGVVYKIRTEMQDKIAKNRHGIELYAALTNVTKNLVSLEFGESAGALPSFDEIDKSMSSFLKKSKALEPYLFDGMIKQNIRFNLSLALFQERLFLLKEAIQQGDQKLFETLSFQLNVQVRHLLRDIYYDAELPLNADIASHRLINALFNNLGPLYLSLPKLLTLTLELTDGSYLTMKDKVELFEVKEQFNKFTEKALANTSSAYLENITLAELHEKWGDRGSRGDFIAGTGNFSGLLNQQLNLVNEGRKVPREALLQDAREVLLDIHAFNNEIVEEILSLLDIQQSTILNKQRIGLAWCIFSIASLLAFYSTRVIRRPVADLKNAAKELEEGNLAVRIEVTASDEVAMMSLSFNQMASLFERIIINAKKITSHLVESAKTIYKTAENLEGNIFEQEKEIAKINGNAKAIKRSVQDFAAYLLEVNEAFQKTLDLATVGREDITHMVNIMQEMLRNTQNIVSMLNSLEEKVEIINQVIYTIVKIADQANLLSLNAAIKAYKSGEKGAGFSVIAVKVRELADQTAQVTLEIEEHMKGVIDEVMEAVQIVKSFSSDMKTQVEDSTEISEQLNRLILAAEKEFKHFESVYEGMQSQAERSEEIFTKATEMIEVSKQTSQSVLKLYHEIEHLHTKTEELEKMTNRFRESPPEKLLTNESCPEKEIATS